MSVLRKLAGQTAIFGFGHILARVLNLALTPLFTDQLNKEEFGTFTELYAQVALINVVLTFGMETTFFRFIRDSKSPREIYNHAFWWVSMLATVLLLVFSGFRDGIATGLGYEGRGLWVLLLGGIIFLDAIAALPMARLREQEKAGRFVFILLMNVGITLGLNIFFILGLGFKEITYILWANLIASAVKVALSLIGNIPNSIKISRKVLKPMLDYGFFIMIAGFAGIMNETLDRAILPRLWQDGQVFGGLPRTGLEMNGIYGANYKVAMLISLAIQAFRYAAEPFFFKTSKEKDSPFTFARVFHYFMFAALLGFLVIASFAKEIVSFDFWGLINFTFIDEKFWEGLDVVPILLGAYVFSGAYLNMAIWFKITKQVRFAILFTGIGAIITITGNVLFVPAYGYFASAWATLACYIVMCGLVYFMGQRYYPIPYRIGRISLYGLLVLIAYITNQWIGPTDGFVWAFVFKAFTCLLAIGVMVGMEKYRSPFKELQSP